MGEVETVDGSVRSGVSASASKCEACCEASALQGVLAHPDACASFRESFGACSDAESARLDNVGGEESSFVQL